MKSLMSLTASLLDEIGRLHCTCTMRDMNYISQRVDQEGDSFLTITLPSFMKDLQKGLSQGSVASVPFLGFRRIKGQCLPTFLSGFTKLLFDSRSGVLKESIDPLVVADLRQLLLLHEKVQLPCTEARNRAAIEQYLQTEEDVREFDKKNLQWVSSDAQRIFNYLFSDVLVDLDWLFFDQSCLPSPAHGPGKTVDRLFGNQKFFLSEWTERLDRVFPVADYLLVNHRYNAILDECDILPPGKERPSKVVLIPKTLKTPRVIAKEPTCMAYAQQAIMKTLVPKLESSKVRRQIGFTDQAPNRAMAREGSIDGSLATLDLSSASDRVSNQLVRALLSRFPHFSEAIDASRSRKADVPGVGVIRLAKFASMGSATCFPIEAMVFLTAVYYGIESHLGHQLTAKDIPAFNGRVRVFGDDIIVPTDMVHSVIDALELFGSRVNRDKSFWTGSFRESCGGDYFAGTDVTPVRFRKAFPSSRKDAPEVSSLVSFRNHLYQKGYWTTCGLIDKRLEHLFSGYYPIVEETSRVLGRYSYSFPAYAGGWDNDLHIPLVRGYVEHGRPPINPVDGHPALMKFFLKGSDEPLDREHLKRSGRCDVVRIQRRWTSPF